MDRSNDSRALGAMTRASDPERKNDAMHGLTLFPKFFEHAAFYGGTALRLLYGMNRYSEDLDFSLLQPDRTFDFSPFCRSPNPPTDSADEALI